MKLPWPFSRKSWMHRMADRIHKGGPASMFSWAAAKFIFGAGIGVLLVAYFPHAPRDGWEPWGWTLVLLSLVISIPALKALFNK